MAPVPQMYFYQQQLPSPDAAERLRTAPQGVGLSTLFVSVATTASNLMESIPSTNQRAEAEF